MILGKSEARCPYKIVFIKENEWSLSVGGRLIISLAAFHFCRSSVEDAPLARWNFFVKSSFAPRFPNLPFFLTILIFLIFLILRLKKKIPFEVEWQIDGIFPSEIVKLTTRRHKRTRTNTHACTDESIYACMQCILCTHTRCLTHPKTHTSTHKNHGLQIPC